MSADSRVFTTEADAMHKTMELYRTCMKGFGICEYGISTIEIPRDF